MQHDRYTTASISHTIGFHPVARKLLLISRPWGKEAELAWAHSRLTACSRLLEPWATWKLRVRYSATRPLAPTEAHGCEQLAQSCYIPGNATDGSRTHDLSITSPTPITTTPPSYPRSEYERLFLYDAIRDSSLSDFSQYTLRKLILRILSKKCWNG